MTSRPAYPKLKTVAPVPTSSVSTFTLLQFDYTDFGGGVGGFTVPTNITAEVKVLMFCLNDHGNRTWQRTVVWSVDSGFTFSVRGSANGNSGSGGIVGDANSSIIAFDVSGNTGRVRVTPASTDSYLWYCTIDFTIEQFS